MEQIYHWIGLVAFWVISGVALLSALSYLIYQALNILGRYYKSMWNIIDYLRNREDFNEWKKEQE